MSDGCTGLLLTPGAGADRDQSALVAIDNAAAAAGATVVRMDFPYRKAGRRAPDKPAVLIEAVVEAATELRARTDRLVLGGRSMGGRMCSMAVAEGLAADALLLVSYPLHPPGRPEKLRSAHFRELRLPCLFVSGTRDAFATPAELEDEVSVIPGPVILEWVEGKDHAMRGTESVVAEIVTGWLRGRDLL